MQAFKSLFTRAQAQRAVALPPAQATQPTEMSAESLTLVSGGLPRVGGLGGWGTTPETGSAAATLPSVS